MSAGTGYLYLMRTVAAADGARPAGTPLTRYYTAEGNPPGRWIGSGLSGLGCGQGLERGSVASESQMFHLFGMGQDPVTGLPLGRRPDQPATGAPRGAVAGFDLTFSAPKSVSAWWAVADGATQQRIVAAHHAAMSDCVDLLERQVAATRIGVNGVAQMPVRGLVAAGFDHWDSRAGDPQLHTHLVIANRVQAADGRWRTLDSRALYRSIVAVSETYNALLADHLAARLGVRWSARPRRHSPVPAWEIAGVPDRLMESFSQRATAIEATKNGLVGEFRRVHGRHPTAVEVLKLREQATLTTRPEKSVRSLQVMTGQWRQQASKVLGEDSGQWAAALTREPFRGPTQVPPSAADLAPAVLSAVASKRSTWGRWNLHAEATRQLMGHRFNSAADRARATAALVEAALALSTPLSPPELAHIPAMFRRPDGTSTFRPPDSQQFTSRVLLDAEARLLSAGRDATGPRIASIAEQLNAVSPALGGDQVAAIEAICGSGRVVDALVGPAGTGKTTALAALRHRWEAQHGPGSVIGLAPSATAAEVLAADLGIDTENTAKWLTEAARERERLAAIDRYRAKLHQLGTCSPKIVRAVQQCLKSLTDDVERWRLHAGQLVIVDEASLTGTVVLDRLATQATSAGAKLLLVGDWAQLTAVDAGGAFAMLVRDRADVPELGTVRRFSEAWERNASRRLRVGDAAVLDSYADHGRIREGDRTSMLDDAYLAWSTDEANGLRSLLVAPDGATVTELNTRARAELVAEGKVHAAGTSLFDGTTAGIGDRIVTRKNQRLISTGRGFVKNGDEWRVIGCYNDGSLTVRRSGGGAIVRLPAPYVSEHVDLAYATTAHRAQGSTVDSAHCLVTGPGMNREVFYVGMTRGRRTNIAYIATDSASTDCLELNPAAPLTGHQILTAVLARVGADISAHETLRSEQIAAGSIAPLVDEYQTLAAAARQPYRTSELQRAGLSATQVREIEESPACGALVAVLSVAESLRLRPDEHLVQLLRRPVSDADDLASVLHDRVSRWMQRHSTPWRPQHHVAGLIPEVPGCEDVDLIRGLVERADLIEQRAEQLVLDALAQNEGWIAELGPPPVNPTRRQAWREAARAVAVYREISAGPGKRPQLAEQARGAMLAARRLANPPMASNVPDAAQQAPVTIHPRGVDRDAASTPRHRSSR